MSYYPWIASGVAVGAALGIATRRRPRGALNRSSKRLSGKPSQLDPVMDPAYNLREVYKQCILLEDHLANSRKRCQDCISKHAHAIEALLEEARGLDKKNSFGRMTDELHRDIRQVQQELVRGRCPTKVAQRVRSMRKKVNPIVRLAPKQR